MYQIHQHRTSTITGRGCGVQAGRRRQNGEAIAAEPPERSTPAPVHRIVIRFQLWFDANAMRYRRHSNARQATRLECGRPQGSRQTTTYHRSTSLGSRRLGLESHAHRPCNDRRMACTYPLLGTECSLRRLPAGRHTGSKSYQERSGRESACTLRRCQRGSGLVQLSIGCSNVVGWWVRFSRRTAGISGRRESTLISPKNATPPLRCIPWFVA